MIAIIELRAGKIGRLTTWYAAPFEAPECGRRSSERFSSPLPSPPRPIVWISRAACSTWRMSRRAAGAAVSPANVARVAAQSPVRCETRHEALFLLRLDTEELHPHRRASQMQGGADAIGQGARYGHGAAGQSRLFLHDLGLSRPCEGLEDALSLGHRHAWALRPQRKQSEIGDAGRDRRHTPATVMAQPAAGRGVVGLRCRRRSRASWASRSRVDEHDTTAEQLRPRPGRSPATVRAVQRPSRCAVPQLGDEASCLELPRFDDDSAGFRGRQREQVSDQPAKPIRLADHVVDHLAPFGLDQVFALQDLSQRVQDGDRRAQLV